MSSSSPVSYTHLDVYKRQEQEIEIVTRHAAGFDPRDLVAAGIRAVASAADLAAGAAEVCQVRIAPEVAAYIVDIGRATRQSPSLSLGVSPRCLLYTSRCV